MRRARTRIIGGLISFVVAVAAVLSLLTWQQVSLGKLNHDLIEAVKAGDTRQVIALLERGADPNAHDDPPRKLSLWEIMLEALQRKRDVSNAPSALQLALEWRPEIQGSGARPTIADTPLIQALVHRGAHLGAREILARAARNYDFCASYQDTGSLDMTGHPDHLTFRTAFVRPNRLYFEYERSPEDHMVIWENSTGTRRWWPRQEVQKGPLEMAIASATGVSLGVADRIPGTLARPQMGGWGGMAESYSDVRMAGTETVDGVPCYKLIPKEDTTSPVTVTGIYIDTRLFLLRKIVESYGRGEMTTTIYHPSIDIPIKESTFHFQPPK